MEFKTLKIQNFLSISELSIDLSDNGLTLITGENKDGDIIGSNGAGKSSIFEALVFVLYGTTLRGLKGDEVVNNLVGNNTLVSLEIKKDEHHYLIERYRKHKTNKNKVKVFKDNVEVTQKSDTDTTKFIEDLIEMNHQTFTASVVYTANSFKFTSSSDADMKAVFEKLLGLNKLKKCHEYVGELTKINTSEIRYLEENLRKISNQKSDTLEEQQKLQKSAEEFDDEKSERLKDYNNSIKKSQENINKYTKWLSKAEKSIETLEEERQEKKSQLKKLKDNKELQDLKEQYEDLQTEIREYSQGITKLQTQLTLSKREMKSYARELERLEAEENKTRESITSNTMTCPHCGETFFDKEHLDKELSRLAELSGNASENLLKARDNVKDLKKQIEELESLKAEEKGRIDKFKESLDAKTEEVEASCSSLENELEKASDLLNSAKSDVKVLNAKLSFEKSNLESLTKQINAEEQRENPFFTLLNACRDKIVKLDDEHASSSKEIAKNQNLSTMLDFWKTAFSNQGIKSLILDNVVPKINQRANYYLRKITNGQIKVELSTQTTLKSGEIREKFSISVNNKNGGESYLANSTGERKRIDLAINLALQDLVASRANSSINLVLWDEVFDGLDDNGIDGVIDLLQEIAEVKSSIFVISHNSLLKSYFSNVVNVTKVNGKSTI